MPVVEGPFAAAVHHPGGGHGTHAASHAGHGHAHAHAVGAVSDHVGPCP